MADATFPYAFTEQGVAMLSSVLNSDRAIEVNIAIMRAFVRLREILATHKDLSRRLDELEKKLGQQDEKIQAVLRPFASSWPRRPRPRDVASASRPLTKSQRKKQTRDRPSESEARHAFKGTLIDANLY